MVTGETSKHAAMSATGRREAPHSPEKIEPAQYPVNQDASLHHDSVLYCKLHYIV